MEDTEYIEYSLTTKELLEKHERRQQSNVKDQIIKKPMGKLISDNYNDCIPLHCYYWKGRLITVYKSEEDNTYYNSVIRVR